MVSQPSKGKTDFNSLLLEAIDETLSSLGETPKKAIYCQLKTAFNIKTKEIQTRLTISRALERLFGVGAKHLEILFMKSLYVKVRGAC
jgi:ribosomal protein L23